MYRRNEAGKLKEKVWAPRRNIQILMGPRQVGKTAMIKELLDEATIPYHYISAAEFPAPDATWLDQQWDLIRLKLKISNSQEALLVIDEIQRIEGWEIAVSQQWEKDTQENVQVKLVLPGTLGMVGQRKISETLSGKFEIIPLVHWSYAEMKEAFRFSHEQYVWFGGYPGSAKLVNDEASWKAYVLNTLVESTLSKDLLMMTRVDKPALLRRLFELGCYFSGQVVSYTKLLGKLQDAGNTITIANYLRWLDSAGLLTGLEKYAVDKNPEKASSPKWLVQDPSLFSVYSGLTFREASNNPAFWARCVESAIGAHLIGYCRRNKQCSLFYWKEREHEVDFVLELNNRTVLFELRLGPRSGRSGAKLFKERFKTDKQFIIGSGGISWQDFLLTNPREL